MPLVPKWWWRWQCQTGGPMQPPNCTGAVAPLSPGARTHLRGPFAARLIKLLPRSAAGPLPHGPRTVATRNHPHAARGPLPPHGPPSPAQWAAECRPLPRRPRARRRGRLLSMQDAGGLGRDTGNGMRYRLHACRMDACGPAQPRVYSDTHAEPASPAPPPLSSSPPLPPPLPPPPLPLPGAVGPGGAGGPAGGAPLPPRAGPCPWGCPRPGASAAAAARGAPGGAGGAGGAATGRTASSSWILDLYCWYSPITCCWWGVRPGARAPGPAPGPGPPPAAAAGSP
jgi:hypothetical protein